MPATNYKQMTIPMEDHKTTPTVAPFAPPGVMIFNCGLPAFQQTGEAYEAFREFNSQKKDKSGAKRKMLVFPCKVADNMGLQPVFCPICGAFLKKNGTTQIDVLHIPFGTSRTVLRADRQQYQCTNPECRHKVSEEIPFKIDAHKVTQQLENLIKDLLGMSTITLKDIATITKTDKGIIKDIDKKRLLEQYTEQGEDGKRKMKPQTVYSPFIGIDEFLLHKGHQYATIIIDLTTGHVLQVARGKKKDVVYKFMDWVGKDWMKHVKAVACDMNTDYCEAFQERYPDIKVVFDYFHIIKNFNEKVVSEVRKDEYRRLIAEGRVDEAKHLKGAKYILMSSRESLEAHDALMGQVIKPGSQLFDIPEVKVKKALTEIYDKLISENKLFLTIDMIKEELKEAFTTTDADVMKKMIGHIIAVCYATGNSHFKWFGNMLKNHRSGILTHAESHLSSGKVEGTNRLIKTIRWQAYGFKDDEYFFLKIMDASRR